MTSVDVKGLTFGYDGSEKLLFENTNFILDTTWHLGLVGRNGRGKTTLINILSGKLQYSGKIIGQPTCAVFPYKLDDEMAMELSIDIAHVIAPNAQDWEIIRELSLMDVNVEVLYRPYNTLSGGEQTKLQLCCLYLTDADFELIDEPTNHLDEASRHMVAKYIKSKKGCIIVSHDRSFLDETCDHILAINKSSIDVNSGNFSTWYDNYMKQENFEKARSEQLKKEIGKLDKAKAQTASWANRAESSKIGFNPLVTEKSAGRRTFESSKSAKVMSLSKNIERRIDKQISEKQSLLGNRERVDTIKISQEPYRSATLLTVKDLMLSRESESSERTIISSGISFSLTRGERLAITGKNGCGKSTLLKYIAGIAQEGLSVSGNVSIPRDLRISYVSQSTDALHGMIRQYCQEQEINETQLKVFLNKFGFTSYEMNNRIEQCSEGQKKLLLIATSFCKDSNLFIWDEPLNYIDIYTRMQIEELLAKSSITMLFTEHDKSFREKVSTNELELS